MWNTLTSYFTQATAEPEQQKASDTETSLSSNVQKFEVEKGDEMNQYNKFNQDSSPDDKKMSQDGQKSQGGQPTGIMNSIFTKMSGHPTCNFIIEFPQGREHLTAGDTLKGKIEFKTTVDGQHIQH